MPKTRRRDADIDKRVGARLRFIRLDRGLSQTALGDALEISFQQIQKYEKGTNAIASTRILQLCQILKIKPNDLFDGAIYKTDHVTADGVALDFAIRIAKLGTKARQSVSAILELIENNNDARRKETRKGDSHAAATRTP